MALPIYRDYSVVDAITTFITHDTTPEEFKVKCREFPEFKLTSREEAGKVIHAAVKVNNLPLIEYLGKRIWKSALEYLDSSDHTPLLWAIELEQLEAAAMLVRSGANVNGRENCEESLQPLYVAAHKVRSLPLTKLLLLQGATVTFKERENRRVAKQILDTARRELTREIIQRLFERTRFPSHLINLIEDFVFLTERPKLPVQEEEDFCLDAFLVAK